MTNVERTIKNQLKEVAADKRSQEHRLAGYEDVCRKLRAEIDACNKEMGEYIDFLMRGGTTPEEINALVTPPGLPSITLVSADRPE